MRTKGTIFKPKLRKLRGFWQDKCLIKVWDLTKICSWIKLLLGTPWHYLDMAVWSWHTFDGKIRDKKINFNNIFENQIISLHISLCTPKSIAFFEMWLVNANLNHIYTQNLCDCPTVLGKPQGIKSSSTLDFCWRGGGGPTRIQSFRGTFQRTFFQLEFGHF